MPDLKNRISVQSPPDKQLNGLGMMMQQYLEQNFEDFDYKVEEGLKLRGCVTVEVEKEISTTIHFHGSTIQIENGVARDPDLYMSSPYLLLAKTLTGQASPVWGIIQRKIKIKTRPKRLIQLFKIFRFLKVPRELIVKS